MSEPHDDKPTDEPTDKPTEAQPPSDGPDRPATGKPETPAAPRKAAPARTAGAATPPPTPHPLSVWSRLFRDAQNTVTVIGAMAATAAAITLLIYFTVDVLWGFANPYASLVVYLLLPGAFAGGLLLIPTGIWRTRRRRARLGLAASREAYPVIDFNKPHVRTVWTVVIVLTLVNAAILGIAAYKGLEYTDSVEFCGELCHSVMNPQRVSHADSPHARVPCVDCHIGSGASWFVRSKLSGLRQVWATLTGSYSRPIPAPVENLRPARETCEQCHWPQKFYGERLVARTRFASDEANTRSQTLLLIKTGGGDPKLGLHGGIHWFHMERHHEIRFRPGDRRQQAIAWVQYRNPEGETFEFAHEDLQPLSGSEPRIMDCVTCHNQPTHGFRLPSEALDVALENGRIHPSLPYVKRETLAAITADHPDAAHARDGIRAALSDFYQREYPELAAARADEITGAADAAADIWARNVFPEMKITWGTYPDNVGHPAAVPVPDDHEGRTSDTCAMCHVATVQIPATMSAAAAPRPPEPVPEPEPGPAAAPATGGPPTVPHAVTVGGDCLGCHGAGRSPFDAGAPGCYRCHNDRMRMTAGPRPLEIATDCNTCHFMSFVGRGDLVIPRPFLALP